VLLNDTKGNNSGWIVITTGWGLAVFVGVTVAGPYSGAHLNPAVTIGLAIVGKFAWANALSYIVAQMLGAFLGAFLVWLMYYDHFQRTNNPGFVLAVFCTGPAVRNYISNIASEIIGSFVLIFVVFYIKNTNRAWFGRRFAGCVFGLGDRSLIGRNNRLCHQPGARSGSARYACCFTHKEQRQQ
jgi:glycerol uptake facilitator-like aquaporin